GGHLHDVGTDDVHSTQAAEDLEQFAAGDAAGFGGSGAGCVGRVQHVNVHGNIQRQVPDPVAQLVHDLTHSLVVDIRAGDDAEAEALIILEVLLPIERAAGAHMGDGLGVEDAFLHGATEGGAVSVFGTEVGVPGIQV